MLPLPFVGSLGLAASALIAIVVLIVLLRVAFALAWRLAIIGAVVLGILWLLNQAGINTPVPTPF